MHLSLIYIFIYIFTIHVSSTQVPNIINVKLHNNHLDGILKRIKDAVHGGIRKIKQKLRLDKRMVTNRVFGNTNANLFSFHGMISVGNPGQSFRILFDTGSVRLWVRSTPCQNPPCPNSYNPMLSTSLVDLRQQAPKIAYGDGSTVYGRWVKERVAVGDIAVNNFVMELATFVNYTTGDEDGIMGLGFSSGRTPETSFWEGVLNSQQVPSPVFSYFIDSTETSGGITFGGVDLNRFSGSLSWTQVIPSIQSPTPTYLYWKLQLNGISLANNPLNLYQVPEKMMQPIIDTGTSLGIFPQMIADSINNGLGLPYLTLGGDKQSFRGMQCPDGRIPNNLPPVTLHFGNTLLTFTSQEYLFIQTDDFDQLVCISGFSGDTSGTFIIGNVLLRKYYVVFDQQAKQIGWAIANRDPEVVPRYVAGSFRSPPYGVAPSFTPRYPQTPSYNNNGNRPVTQPPSYYNNNNGNGNRPRPQSPYTYQQPFYNNNPSQYPYNSNGNYNNPSQYPYNSNGNYNNPSQYPYNSIGQYYNPSGQSPYNSNGNYNNPYGQSPYNSYGQYYNPYGQNYKRK